MDEEKQETEQEAILRLSDDLARTRGKLKILNLAIKVIRSYSSKGLLIHHLCQEALTKIGDEE